MKIINQVIKTTLESGDPLKSIQDHLKTPAYLGNVVGTIMRKVKVPDTIGTFNHFQGSNSLINATKFAMQTVGSKGEIIPKAFEMLENLKKVGAAGNNIPFVSAIGGSNLLGLALAGILKLVKQSTPKSQNKPVCEDVDEIEAQMRELYESIFGMSAIEQDCEESLQYKTWKEELLKEVNNV